MHVLIQIKDPSTDREIREFTEEEGNDVYIAHSTEESIAHLSRAPIDKAIISLKGLNDAAILQYLNTYYPGIEIVVIANKTFDNLISIFRKVNYSVIQEPLRLADLKGKLDHKKKTLHNTVNNTNN